MSTSKRSRSRRQPEAASGAEQTAFPAQKRLKSSHTSAKKEGLGFLVDEDARQGRKVGGKLTNGVPSQKTTRVDESKAVVASETRGVEAGKLNEVIDISSAAEESSDDDDEEEEASNGAKVNGHASALQTPAATEDVDMADDEPVPEEPSFGDMLQARHPDPIDVAAAYPTQAESQALAPATGNQKLTAPTGTSLSTVLTQALRTNDKDMLESCFQMTDQQSIRTTIQRLQPHLIGSLMQKLAERIHRRPGRTGHLMTWIQWSLVAHGGYLVTQPEVMRKLRALNQVMRERAQGLRPLLQLKGKLDMLGAQLELRRQTLALSAGARDDDDDEEGVLYIENRDPDDDGSDTDTAIPKATGSSAQNLNRPSELEYHTTSDDSGASDDDEDMPNGVHIEGDESADDDEDEAAGGQGLFDIEAEESGDEDDADEDSGDEDESSASSASDGGDLAAGDEESDDEEIVVKQAKPQALNRKR